MAKIREDGRGIYVIAGGYIFRPRNGVTKFKVGDNIPARHIGGSSFGTVGKGVDRESWENLYDELSPEAIKAKASMPKCSPLTYEDRKKLAEMQIDAHENCIKMLRKLDMNSFFDQVAPIGLIEDVIKEAESDVSAMKKNINGIR